MIGRTVSHFRILAKLGAGGMGVVYKAEDTQLGRPVALKFLRPELIQDEAAKKRLIHEARAISSLQHRNICTIHEIGQADDGRMFICMDYYEGETLKERLGRGPLSAEEAIDFTRQIAAGLAEAHGREILHRDIKPANVMVTKQGEVKLLDFGLARLAGQTKLTQSGSTVGTAAYMSPEQIRGEDLDPRSDIFSLGVVFYELLTGTSPFAAEYEPAVTHKILHVAPPSLRTSGVKNGAQLDPVVGKMLAKERSERFASAREVINALAKIERSGQTPTSKRSRRRGAVVSAALGVVLVGAAAVWWTFGRNGAVQAGEPRLAILYFENVATPHDPERLGEMATSLLITDLSESQYVKVVSSQRLYDILNKLGKEGEKVIDRNTATAVAREAQATQMLVGSIMLAGGRVEIASQLIDVASGEARASQRIRGAEGDNIFTLVDRLSAEVKRDLELPMGAKLEHDQNVADVTTRSPEAYRYYLEGTAFFNQYKFPEARASFEKAVATDSTFAMAWVYLTHEWIGYNTEITHDERAKALAKAVAFSSKATRKESRFISARAKAFSGDRAGARTEFEALVRDFPDDKESYWQLSFLGDSPAEIIEYLEQIIAIDPLDKTAYNELAYYYWRNGAAEKSIWAINQYIHLAPREANAYDTAGDLYGLNGDVAKVIDSFGKAVELDPGFGMSWCKLGLAYVVAGDEVRAQECWERALALDVVARATARYQRAAGPVYHGKWDEGLKAYQEAIVADQRDQGGVTPAFRWTVFQIGALYAEKGDWPRAAEAFQRAAKIGSTDELSITLMMSIVYLARRDPAAVEKELETLRTLNNFQTPAMHAIARSWVEMERGRYDQAIAAIDTVPDGSLYFWVAYTKGMAYLRAGRWQESIDKLSYCRDMFNTLKNALPPIPVRVHYYLGQAYEGNGEPAKAIVEYEKFIEWWKDADPVFMTDVNDARRRVAKLRS